MWCQEKKKWIVCTYFRTLAYYTELQLGNRCKSNHFLRKKHSEHSVLCSLYTQNVYLFDLIIDLTEALVCNTKVNA